MRIDKLTIGIFFILLGMNSLSLLAESSFELRSAAFFPQNKRFTDIYGDVSPCYEVEISTDAYCCSEGWVNFDWLTKKGHSSGCHEPTRVDIANLSFGIKYPYQLTDRISAYIGIGPTFYRIWLKNHGHNFREKATRFAVGGILKIGVIYELTNCVFVDLFVDYLYQPVHFKTHVNIGGLKTGLGIGVRL